MPEPLVRFAPSPTGHLHIGNMRTALVNYLFARKNGGRFMLRIDDTDDERSTEEYEQSIRDDLAWMGIEWDEEARQSARLDRYEAALERLLADGRAYPCFETPEELALKRKAQLASGRPPVYDRAALKMDAAEISARVDAGEKPHYRFRLEYTDIRWRDLVRGEQGIDISSLSDPVIRRADGRFIYTLASVVDDGEYGVTHILRGEDHTTNSAIQMQLFGALGHDVPAMGHFALLAGSEGESLSKRLGSLSIKHLRDEEGIEPMAIASLLARIGTADPVVAETGMGALVEGFDITRFGRATPRFDLEQLRQINARVIGKLDFDEVRKSLDDTDIDEKLWNAVRGNISTLGEARDWWRIILEPMAPEINAGDKETLAAAIDLLPLDTNAPDSWRVWTNAIKEKTGLEGKAVFRPLRLALTGRGSGPDMADLLPLLGRERILGRLKGEKC